MSKRCFFLNNSNNKRCKNPAQHVVSCVNRNRRGFVLACHQHKKNPTTHNGYCSISPKMTILNKPDAIKQLDKPRKIITPDYATIPRIFEEKGNMSNAREYRDIGTIIADFAVGSPQTIYKKLVDKYANAAAQVQIARPSEKQAAIRKQKRALAKLNKLFV